MTNTATTHYDRATTIAKGTYQDDIVTGRESLSGSTLSGKARSYGGRYKASRLALFAALRAAGVEHYVTREKTGKLVLCWGTPDGETTGTYLGSPLVTAG